ncbi:connexin 27.5 [Plakobranchus ocellatus]|uniref:Connexin 27.5 n=1 Tax=Plakobranchus ocellatus TaxID=259542 RepID=A0AAV4CLG6_9GAST|nr:connexin 27.5 [Plakobranchus ocellatus]
MLGCMLHLIHIVARKGPAHLAPFVEALIDLFYYFKKSATRQDDLKAFQDLFNTDRIKCLKHVATRWLSIQSCVDRLLHNWDALKAYFLSEKARQKSPTLLETSNADSLRQFLRSPTNQPFGHFLLYAIKLFDPVLIRLQTVEPLIHQLLPTMEELLKMILTKFITPEASVKDDHHKALAEAVQGVQDSRRALTEKPHEVSPSAISHTSLTQSSRLTQRQCGEKGGCRRTLSRCGDSLPGFSTCA